MKADLHDNHALDRFDEEVRAHEDTVLGGVLSNPAVIKQLHCTERDFRRPQYQKIFRLFAERVSRDMPVGDSYVAIRSAGLLDEDHDKAWYRDITRDRELIGDAQTVGSSALLRRARMWHEIQVAYSQGYTHNSYADPADFFDRIDRIRGLAPSNGSDRQTYWEKRGYAPPIDVKTFLERDFNVEYLVERCLAKGSACTIAGASKSMKTTVSLYLAICLAAGKPFLDRFHTQKTRVMIASAESGEGVLQRNLRGLADMMGIDLRELCEDGYLSIQFWVPKVANQDMLNYFGDCIDSVKPGVVVMDPLYLALDGDSQANLSLNGEQLHALVQTIHDRECTAVVDDHVKRSSGNAKEYKPLQLEDITGAGKSEYFRQWMLLGRRSRVDDTEDTNTRKHELWLSVGGSAGHSGTWGLDIEETFDESFEAVRYAVDLRPVAEVRGEAKSVDSSARESREEQRAKTIDERLKRKADELVNNIFNSDYTLALTGNEIEARLSGVTSKEVKRVIAIATDSGRIQLVPKAVERSNGQKYSGFMLTGSIGASSSWDPNRAAS